MSIYRSILAVLAAVAIASPVFAEDAATTTPSTETPATVSPVSETMQTQAPASEATTTTAEQTKVNVNTATVKQLMKVKGMNASKARAIVAFRKKHGEFKTMDDLKSVNGFKRLKAEKMQMIQDQLTVE